MIFIAERGATVVVFARVPEICFGKLLASDC